MCRRLCSKLALTSSLISEARGIAMSEDIALALELAGGDFASALHHCCAPKKESPGMEFIFPFFLLPLLNEELESMQMMLLLYDGENTTVVFF